MEKPSRGGEKRTAVWASHHEERGSDEVVAPPVCAHRGVPHRWVVFDQCNPSGAAADAGRDAAARVLGAVRAAEDGVVSIPQALHGSPSAPPIPAQRVARFDGHCTRNYLLKNKLRRRYSRCRQGHIPPNLVVGPWVSHTTLDITTRSPHHVSSSPTAICMEMRHGTKCQTDTPKPHHHRRFPR
jgi:hypothetical protein